MKIEELREKRKALGEKERSRRYRECLNSGGCQKTFGQAPEFQEYCAYCLTLYAHGQAQDPPPIAD